jgi:hypothetical protein
MASRSLWRVADPAPDERKSELGQLDVQLVAQLEITSPEGIVLGSRSALIVPA